jgi:hypothetical protein
MDVCAKLITLASRAKHQVPSLAMLAAIRSADHFTSAGGVFGGK